MLSFILAADPVSVADQWSQWLTPQGISAAIGLLTTMLTAAALILNLLGRKKLAGQLTEARDQIDAHKSQATASVEMVRAVVHGVEEAKSGLDPATRQALADSIQKVSSQAGVEPMLAPIVTAIQAGKTDTPALMKTLTDTLAALQPKDSAAPPAVLPAVPPGEAAKT